MQHRMLIRIYPAGEAWPVHFGRPDGDGVLWSDEPLADCSELGLMLKRGLHQGFQARVAAVDETGRPVRDAQTGEPQTVVLTGAIHGRAGVCDSDAEMQGEVYMSALNIGRIQQLEQQRPGILAALGIEFISSDPALLDGEYAEVAS